MDINAERYMHDEGKYFLQQQRPTFDEYREAKRIETTTSKDLRGSESELVAAAGTQQHLLAQDPRALALSVWAEVLILLLLAGGEAFVNYLAAEGLLQDQRTTIGITIFLTLIVAFLAFGLAREDRHHRRDAKRGKFPDIGWVYAVLLGSTVAYLGLSLFLRERYFNTTRALARILGSFASDPWLVASALTVLAAVGIAATVYVLSHVDNELAAAKRAIRRLEHKIPKLKDANEDALGRISRAKDILVLGTEVSRNNVITRLGAGDLLDGNETARSETSEQILEYFRNLWRSSVDDHEPTGKSAEEKAQAADEDKAKKTFPRRSSDKKTEDESRPPDLGGGTDV